MEIHKFNNEHYKKSGKTAFSLDYPTGSRKSDMVKHSISIHNSIGLDGTLIY